MRASRTLSKLLFVGALVCALLAVTDFVSSSIAGGGVQTQRAGPADGGEDGHKPFGPGHHPKVGQWNKESDPELRKELFKEWKANDPKDTSYLSQQRQAAAAPAVKRASRARATTSLLSGVMGRASIAMNDAGQILITKKFGSSTCDPDPKAPITWSPGTPYSLGTVRRPSAYHGFNFQVTVAGTSDVSEPAWPTTIGATIVDNTVTWKAIAFPPGTFTGCTPMQLVIRDPSTTEHVIASEGDAVGAPVNGVSKQLSGWGEFYGINNPGVAVFKASVAGSFAESNPDEGGVGVFTSPAAGPLTEVVETGATIGGKTICGIGPWVWINDAGQVGFEAMVSNSSPCPNTSVGETPKAVYRFTPPSTFDLLMAFGQDIGGGVTITHVGVDSGDDNDLSMNSLGHMLLMVKLSDGGQGLYLLKDPLNFVQVARSGAPVLSTTFDQIADRPKLNNSDKVFFKASLGGDGNPYGTEDGVDNLLLFTPPSTYTVVAKGANPPTGVTGGDDLGLRSGGAANGITFIGFAAFLGYNNCGDALFRARLNGITQTGVDDNEPVGLYVWNHLTGNVTEVARTGTTYFGFFAESMALNDIGRVLFATKTATGFPKPGGGSYDTSLFQDGLFIWDSVGGATQLLKVGDTLNGGPVSTIYTQHHSFSRQYNNTPCVVATAFLNQEDPDEDTFGQTEKTYNGQLFLTCLQGPGSTCLQGTTPTPTPTPTPTSPPASTPTLTPTPVRVAAAVPTLTWPFLAILAMILAAAGLLTMKK